MIKNQKSPPAPTRTSPLTSAGRGLRRAGKIKMQNYNSKFKILIFLIVILIFAFLFLIWQRGSGTAPQNLLDSLAKCLASKGITMYGAYWCPHCQNEKAAFGSSFRYIPYVECAENPQKCLEVGIKGYPTWIFSDGRRFEGEQGLQRLAQESGCPLP